MAGFLIFLLIATLLGFLAGMGVGGGSLLLLWLTQVAMLEQTQARIINLLFFLPAASGLYQLCKLGQGFIVVHFYQGVF